MELLRTAGTAGVGPEEDEMKATSILNVPKSVGK
jgi:hypothetical protein